jgi:hypothetical protein
LAKLKSGGMITGVKILSTGEEGFESIQDRH